MEYRLVTKPSFTIAGKSLRVSTDNADQLKQIPKFWSDSREDGTVAKLQTAADKGQVLPECTLGICTDFSPKWDEFTYWIAADASGIEDKDGLAELTVPSAEWAVFDSTGTLPNSIQSVWKAIYSEFFPKYPFVQADGPSIEVYPKGDTSSPDYHCEVWIPVAPKTVAAG